MRKNTLPFMLALLASAHLMQAAGKSFTATIKAADNLATQFPGLMMNIPLGTSSQPINNSGITQVTLIDGNEYTLTACADPITANLIATATATRCMDRGDGTLLNYKFRANKKTPIIVISDPFDLLQAGGHSLTVSFQKS